MKKITCFVLAASMAFMACTSAQKTTLSGLNPSDFVTVVNQKPTALYTLTNASGMEVCITNFGGRVVSIMVPDKDGVLRDVVLGFDSVEDYINIPSDFGASIGRYANRINKGQFSLDGVDYQLPVNDHGHCLHGGPEGWQYQVYEVKSVTDNSLTLVMDSPDGDANFPGHVVADVVFTLTDDNKLDIAYSAVTDAPTIINMTNHCYFNLGGDASQTVSEDVLYLNAGHYTPVDDTYMTSGEILPVDGTPMDFRTPKAVGTDIGNFGFEQIKNANGFDHNWVLDTAGDIAQVAAELYSPASGIDLKVYTNEPGIQFYSGNFLDSTATGKNGILIGKNTGICLETQHYPDSPNKSDWPSVVLRPGETYTSHCIYAFSVK